MSIRDIPAEVEITCDVCGKKERQSRLCFSHGCTMKFEYHYSEGPGPRYNWDVCDECIPVVLRAIDSLKKGGAK